MNTGIQDISIGFNRGVMTVIVAASYRALDCEIEYCFRLVDSAIAQVERQMGIAGRAALIWEQYADVGCHYFAVSRPFTFSSYPYQVEEELRGIADGKISEWLH